MATSIDTPLKIGYTNRLATPSQSQPFFARLKANLQATADVDAFCDILRLLSRSLSAASEVAPHGALPPSAGSSWSSRGTQREGRFGTTFLPTATAACVAAAAAQMRRSRWRGRTAALRALTERDTVKMEPLMRRTWALQWWLTL
eukprot:Skav231367  [mRNA]  locus=scaffold1586:517368:523497:+ [translate_table: standard]